ncbi:MAG: AraC family transcriptional regulator [Firmicutes bacterium]|nr:AraC family transcriptional regulator [Bacillota bacterium]
MDNLKSRMSFLRGYVEGLQLDENTKEGKVLNKLIAVMDDICNAVEELKEEHDELFSYMEAIDEDLTELEKVFYEEDLEEDLEEEDDKEAMEGFYIECPECHEEVFVEEDALDDDDTLEVLCPKCGKVVFINDDEWDDDELDEDLALEDDEESADKD